MRLEALPDNYFVRRTRNHQGKRIRNKKILAANRIDKRPSGKVDMRRYRTTFH